ncbi:MAG: type II toxin-antitoxin system HicB family antitoxin [Acidobacteriota bacterium]|nr:MAG: type II toxin-antitoxin system HicB family antitoxin [Acidobacteriota bacterium]
MANLKYRFQITWSEEDEAYVATVPEFPGLAVVEADPEKALAEARKVLLLYVESYKEHGERLPSPEVARTFSGQVSLRLPKSLHEESVRLASDDGISLNQFLVLSVQSKIDEYKSERQVGFDRYSKMFLHNQLFRITTALFLSEWSFESSASHSRSPAGIKLRYKENSPELRFDEVAESGQGDYIN